MKILLFLLLLASSAWAQSTSKNVAITVTHTPVGGAAITSFTFTNYSGTSWAAGTPVSFGQGFRYGDVMPGSFPVIRDAATHTNIPTQQWDYIATFNENGGNGSWKHAVWSIAMPVSLASGASYTVEFALAAGTYSQGQTIPLANLCSGHDLKIHLTDVRNQNDTTRVTGDATFDLCANVANTGRDAPRIIGAGSVRTEAQIMGQFVYTNSTKDPLLYALCDVGLYVSQEVEWVCHVMSPWMNVAAGSAGNAGSPGPVGLANDPQIISYRAEVDDGATDVLDWHNYDTTLNSASNPAIPCPESYGGPNCLNVPSSTGNNTWYWPMTVRVTSCSGTCVGGLTQGQLAWAYPSGIASARTWPTALSTQVNLLATPQVNSPSAGTGVLTTSQGTGTTTFQHRFWQSHWSTWQTLDASADENWSPPGSATRFTRRFYPQFTTAQQTYWEQTGLVPPLDLTQNPSVVTSFATTASPNIYTPLGRMNVFGGTGGSFRPDIGLISDYAASGFISQTQSNWYAARLFSFGAQAHGWTGVLNEATGFIPPENNGPIGGGGQGTGAAYPVLGTPFPTLRYPSQAGGNMAQPLQGVPNGTFDWAGGMWGLNGTFADHTPSFGSLTYIIWGQREFLDLMRWTGNHVMTQFSVYATEPQNLYYSVRDTQLPLGPGHTAYYCNVLLEDQNRGSAWALRDVTLPAAFGADGDPERVYYNDCVTEMANSYPAILTFMNGSATNAVQNSATPANFGGAGGSQAAIDVFIGSYMFDATYQLWTFVHSPLATLWIPTFTRWYQVLLGGGTVAGSLDPFYGVDFSSNPAIHNGDCVFSGGVIGSNIGACYNAVDATDMGGFGVNTAIASNGLLTQGFPGYTLTAGDPVKWIGAAASATPSDTVDQLPGNTWFKVIGPIDNSARTYHIENPATPGVAFTSFTRGSSPLNESVGSIIYRPTFVPAPAVQGFANSNYCFYARQTLAGLTILGQDVTAPQANFVARAGGNINNCLPPFPDIWNPTIRVPGP